MEADDDTSRIIGADGDGAEAPLRAVGPEASFVAVDGDEARQS